MKKIRNKVLLVALFLCGTVMLTRAQENTLKINILSPIVKTFNVQYERKLNADASFQLGFFYSGYTEDNSSWSGFGITPEYRIYLSEDSEAPKGVYIAPFVRYQSFTIKDASSSAKFSAFGGGVIIGKQWIFKEKIALDMFLGPSYMSGSTSDASTGYTPSTSSFSGFGLRAGICFGLAF